MWQLKKWEAQDLAKRQYTNGIGEKLFTDDKRLQNLQIIVKIGEQTKQIWKHVQDDTFSVQITNTDQVIAHYGLPMLMASLYGSHFRNTNDMRNFLRPRLHPPQAISPMRIRRTTRQIRLPNRRKNARTPPPIHPQTPNRKNTRKQHTPSPNPKPKSNSSPNRNPKKHPNPKPPNRNPNPATRTPQPKPRNPKATNGESNTTSLKNSKKAKKPQNHAPPPHPHQKPSSPSINSHNGTTSQKKAQYETSPEPPRKTTHSGKTKLSYLPTES